MGALIGLLAVATLALAKHKVAASSAYAAMAGLIGRIIAPRHIASLPYFRENKPAVGWSIVFGLGAVLGALLAAYTGGEVTGTYLHGLWIARFGEDSYALRTGFSLLGGVLMAFGARMAGGCTSGHGISGTLQLAVKRLHTHVQPPRGHAGVCGQLATHRAWTMTMLAAALAVLVGLSLGLLGGGGSILTLPILLFAVGMSPKPAISAPR